MVGQFAAPLFRWARPIWRSSAALLLALGLSFGSANAASPDDPKAPDIENAPTAATSNWRQSQKSLRIGVLSPGGVERAQAVLRPFQIHMQRALGLPVELVPTRNMRMLIDAIVNARVDYAPLSASAYAAGWALCRCLEPLAAPLAGDETAGFHAIVVARSDSGFRRLVDLKDKALVYSGPASIAGYLVPRAAFRAEGVDDETFFAKTGHAQGPVAAVRSMLAGDYDAALAWTSLDGDVAAGYSRGTLATMIADGQLSMDDIRIVWQSRLIPHGPHVVRTNLPERLKTLIRATLFELAQSDPDAYDAIEPNYPGGFAAVSHEAYSSVLNAFDQR